MCPGFLAAASLLPLLLRGEQVSPAQKDRASRSPVPGQAAWRLVRQPHSLGTEHPLEVACALELLMTSASISHPAAWSLRTCP